MLVSLIVETTGRALAAVLEQVVHEQAHDLELVDERALLVGGPGAVGVAIEQQAEVVAARPDALAAPRPRCGRIGSGLSPPNQGLRSPWISSTTIRPPGEQATDPARARAVQRVDEDPHGLGPESIEVERAAHVGLVAGERVEALDERPPPRHPRTAAEAAPTRPARR